MTITQPGRKRILYVEDHQDTGELVATLLCDHEVVVVGNKAEGQMRATLERFDLYIFDYNLPDGTGIELCLFIRTYDHQTPIVLCTASTSLTELQVTAAGAQYFIKKGPLFIDCLVEAVSQSFSAAA
ncbi:MAG TPA: response regulator [Pyrinomonadaceae bacterium]|nr:response regulator [Pyrinomonadaceae bacterium]